MSGGKVSREPTWWRVFGLPIIIGALSLGGLLSALLAGDVGRYFSWLALGIPVLIVCWAYFRRA
jgi:hypothetical protein